MLFGLFMTTESLKTHGQRRNPRFYPESRKWLKGNPTCSACGGRSSVEVHHVEPFHLHLYWPDLFPIDREMDPANWIGLCMAAGRLCHLRIGHAGNFQLWVPEARDQAKIEIERIAAAQKRLKDLPPRRSALMALTN